MKVSYELIMGKLTQAASCYMSPFTGRRFDGTQMTLCKKEKLFKPLIVEE
jgi:hypothetical protein